MTPIEREHICKAFQFELSKVETREVRVRMLDLLEQVHPLLASQVAVALGEAPVPNRLPSLEELPIAPKKWNCLLLPRLSQVHRVG
ncbi:catalase-related domain-containing protein [Deinococcus radiophilus]|uniref:catalase-related domain-containing protein n=1 Tax=Deinococcus radiophilus TaxID=32062 RepID=UPI003608360A